jgi:hypothetical protein
MKRGNGFLTSKSFEEVVEDVYCWLRFQCRILVKWRWKELEEQTQFHSEDE